MPSKLLGIVCIAFALCISIANANPSGTVQFSVSRKQVHRTLVPKPRNRRRDSKTVSAGLTLNDQWVIRGGYFIELEVGVPTQKIKVLLDTSSSNLFDPSGKASECQRGICIGGSYYMYQSLTASNVKSPKPFMISNADGSSVNVSYISDFIDVTPGNWPGGSPQYGIMGVGFEANEAGVCGLGCRPNFTIPTVSDALKAAGFTRSSSYSLYLDDVAAGKGSILFGGVDKAKFVGELVTLGVDKYISRNSYASGLYVYPNLRLTSVSGTINGKTQQFSSGNLSSTFILDSGNPGVSVPPSIYDQIIAGAPFLANYDGADNYIRCKDADTDAFLTFGLTGSNGASTTVDVPVANFVVTGYKGSVNSTTPNIQDGEDLCYFALSRGTANDNAGGDPLLRSAYVYFNNDQKTISLVKPSYDTDDIQAIGAGPVPSVTGAANPKTTAPSAVGGGGADKWCWCS